MLPVVNYIWRIVIMTFVNILISASKPIRFIYFITCFAEQPPPQLQMPMPQQPMIDFRPQPMFGVNGRPMSPGPMRRIMVGSLCMYTCTEQNHFM
jgi:hypothetical protein